MEELAALYAQRADTTQPLPIHEDAPAPVGEEFDLLRVVDAPAHERGRHRQRVYEVGVADGGVARRLLGPERVGVAESSRPHSMVPHLPFEVPPEVQLRDHRLSPETVVAVGGVQKAAV